MEKVYYDPSTGYTGIDPLRRKSNEKRSVVKNWLESQSTYTLHKPARRIYERNKVLVSRIDEQWQMDLVDLSSLQKYNNKYRYLLMCIDIFSKYAWSEPIKSKNSSSVLQAFKNILNSTDRKPEKLQTDAGTEFVNQSFQRFLKENNILFFTTASELKASVVERFNRTIKERMFRYFTKNNTYRYLDILPDLLNGYNNTIHRTIGIEPAKVNSKTSLQILERAYKIHDFKVSSFKFDIGDKVRISKMKGKFEKGYLPNWSEETFVVQGKLGRKPPVYILYDEMGEKLEGVFYETELQKVQTLSDVHTVDKVLKTRKKSGKTEYFVKWKGYPDKFNSWVSRIIKII